MTSATAPVTTGCTTTPRTRASGHCRRRRGDQALECPLDPLQRVDPHLDQAEIRLVGDVGRQHLHDHRQADFAGGRHGLDGGGRHRLGHRGDAEGGQELLRLDLVEGPRRQELLRLACRVRPLGRDLEKRVGQRGHEGGEVHQGLDPPHGGTEGVEQGDAGVAERPVGRVVAQRRAPDCDDRLASPTVEVDEILGQGVAHAGEDPGDGGQEDVGVGVLEHQLEDGPPGGQRGDGPAGVDRVVLAQEPGDVLTQGVDRALLEAWHRESGGRAEVDHVRRRPSRQGVDGHPAGAPRRQEPGMAEHPRDLDDLVEVVDPHHPELREDGVVHGIRTGQMPGVGLGHRPPLVGAAHLDHDDGHPVLGRRLGGQHEGAPVFEPLDVGGDGAGVGQAGVVADEVGELQVGLVADGGPGRDGDAQVLALRDRSPLEAGLGHDGQLLAADVLSPRLEDVEIGVRSQHTHRPRGELFQAPLCVVTLLGPHLREAGGEHHGGPHAQLEAVLQDRQRLAHQHDGQVDGERHGPDRRVRRRAQDLRLRRVHRHDRGTAGGQPFVHLEPLRPLLRPLGVGGADHDDGAGGHEGVPVDRAQGQGAPVEVHSIARHARPCPQVSRGPRRPAR